MLRAQIEEAGEGEKSLQDKTVREVAQDDNVMHDHELVVEVDVEDDDLVLDEVAH